MRRADIPQLQIDAASVYTRMISYINPSEEVALIVSSGRLSVLIDYPADGVSLNVKYGRNPAELEKLHERLRPLLKTAGSRVKSIRLTGYASPDGSTKENERLAGNRAIQFKNYLLKQYGLPNDGTVTIDWVGEDWDGLHRLIAASGKAYGTKVTAILNKTTDPDTRRKEIKALEKGTVYKDIEKMFFAKLRRMELSVESEQQQQTKTDAALSSLADQVYSDPDKLTIENLLQVATLYRPGTEQYREVYELAAYRFPTCVVAQLNAAAASLALGDKEATSYFLDQTGGDPRSFNTWGVLALMNGDAEAAAAYFRKAMPQNPRLSRENLKVTEEIRAMQAK